MKVTSHLFAALMFAAAGLALAADYAPGTRVVISSDAPSGAPVREAPSAPRYVRWPNGIGASVVKDEGRWVEVEVNGSRGWLLEKYLLAEEEEADIEGAEALSVGVGAWNLEYLNATASRGFPEFQHASALPPRTDADYALIAAAIRDRLRTPVLMLSEINGIPQTRRSLELEKLLGIMGPTWKYTLGSKGGINGKQRAAIIYDEARVESLALDRDEIVIPEERVGGDDIFDRDPLVAHFRVKRAGSTPANDFLAVALHLASGQGNAANHSRAMARLRAELKSFCAARESLVGEDDVILGGDLNASRYDEAKEDFWDGYDAAGYKFLTLAPAKGADYPPTRLKGNPLYPGSQIDYLLASAGLRGGLTAPVATVHHELVVGGDFYAYRLHYSDHFPVTVGVLVTDDND